MAEDEVRHGAALPAGTRLNERFEIERCIGSGGFGLVYMARDLKAHGDTVAIKEFFPVQFGAIRAGKRVATADSAARTAIMTGSAAFRNEAILLRKLNHPNVVRVHDWFEENDTVYMVMQMLDGTSLQDLLATGQPVDGSRTESWLTALLGALVLIHREKIVHGDISPANIIITDKNVPVLIDFGAARQSIAQVSLSLAGIVNAGYTPIEGYGEAGADGMIPATDLYALGATFYAVTTGKRPLAAPSRIPVDRLRPASEVAAGHFVPYLLAGIDHAMRVASSQRWESAESWLYALANRSMPPRTHDPAEEAEPPVRRRRPYALIAAWTVAALAVLTAAVQTSNLNSATSMIGDLREMETERERKIASMQVELEQAKAKSGAASDQLAASQAELTQAYAASPTPVIYYHSTDIAFADCTGKMKEVLESAGLTNVRMPFRGFLHGDEPGCVYTGLCTGIPEGNLHGAVHLSRACTNKHGDAARWETITKSLSEQMP